MRATFAACAMLTLLLASCALTPKDMGQAYMFSLSPAKTVEMSQTGTRLTVELPTTSPELDTHRIALIRGRGIRDYYAGARWADFLPVMAQDSIIKTLDGTGLFKAVVASQTGLAADMSLKLEIRDFQAEYSKDGAAPIVRVQLVASLVNRSDRNVISSFHAGVSSSQAANDSLPAIHAAFNAAFLAAQKQIVIKLIQTLMDHQSLKEEK